MGRTSVCTTDVRPIINLAIPPFSGGCSDDGVDDFGGWLIVQGKEVYLNALNNPESLADVKPIKEV